tara:strand:+ start:349 stop:1464 length:1116 start_codon:yes stop_codon:yes gene_type:complete
MKNLKKIDLVFKNISNTIILIIAVSILSIIMLNLYRGLNLFVFFQESEYLDKLQNYSEFEWTNQYFIDQDKLTASYISYLGHIEDSLDTKTIKVSSNGVRNSFNNSDNSEVVFLGGSAMFGFGSNDEFTIPSLFAKYTNMTVKNNGNAGHTSFQGYLKLLNHTRHYRNTSLIISYDGVNEVYNLNSYKREKHSYEDLFNSRISSSRINSMNSKEYSIVNYLIGFVEPLISVTTKVIAKISKKNSTKTFEYTEKDIDNIALNLLSNWSLMLDEARKLDIKFYAVLQPVAKYGDPSTYHLPISQDVLKFYKSLYDKVRLTLNTNYEYQDLKNSFIDLSDIFQGEKFIFYDHVHVSPNGNEEITSYLIDRLNIN